MKKSFLKSIVVLIMIVLVLSCSSDSDSSTPCVPITCLNGGVSNSSCGCNCPTGYSGNNCSTQLTPTQILVSKVVISNFPATKPNGTSWDFNPVNPINNNPDLYLVFINSTQTYFNSVNNRFDDAVAGNQYTYNFTTPVIITSVNNLHNITLYNYNTSGADDEMGSVTFTPYSNTNNFPSIITVTDNVNGFQAQFHVTYQW